MNADDCLWTHRRGSGRGESRSGGAQSEGQPESVRYEQINAMLLNEFLKEHRKVQELEANGARQQKQIDALTAGLQKVSAQLEVSGTASQVVNRQYLRSKQQPPLTSDG